MTYCKAFAFFMCARSWWHSRDQNSKGAWGLSQFRPWILELTYVGRVFDPLALAPSDVFFHSTEFFILSVVKTPVQTVHAHFLSTLRIATKEATG